MSIGAINAAAPILGGLFTLVDSLFTTEDERMAAKLKIMELSQRGDLAQIGVNTQEAQSSSLFVAGWRPFIGWVCGFAFAYNFIVYPILQTIVYSLAVFMSFQVDPSIFPVLSLSEMMPVLLGMLGLGAMRSGEKVMGVSRETWNTADINRSGKE